ncbi:MAG TPA: LysR family transcriptional regulator [Casimicrobiaceae bacterium]|jgi:DNA-binding transcriptional LysR family regulator|nr:LysR family transcriptional regulator [Casimicrobiaceae bacterium]
MDFNRLRSFAAVAEAGHLTRAAEKLHISQPALSAQIRALEDELDLTLFERTSTGMTLTAAGKRLLTEADKVLAASQTFEAEARALKGTVSGKARVGTLSDPAFIRLGEFMAAALERYPRLEVDFQHEITGVAMQRVRDGSLEASFYYGHMPYPQVAGIALRELAYRIAAPAAWSDRLQQAGWREIGALPWILPPPVSSHHQFAAALFREHGVDPAKVIGADDEAVVSSLVASGAGVALMREDVALAMVQAGDVCLWQDIRIGTMLRFIYLRSREHDPIVRALLDVCKLSWPARRDARVASRRQTARKPNEGSAAQAGSKESPS